MARIADSRVELWIGEARQDMAAEDWLGRASLGATSRGLAWHCLAAEDWLGQASLALAGSGLSWIGEADTVSTGETRCVGPRRVIMVRRDSQGGYWWGEVRLGQAGRGQAWPERLTE